MSRNSERAQGNTRVGRPIERSSSRGHYDRSSSRGRIDQKECVTDRLVLTGRITVTGACLSTLIQAR
jgi:hypothetical protein